MIATCIFIIANIIFLTMAVIAKSRQLVEGIIAFDGLIILVIMFIVLADLKGV